MAMRHRCRFDVPILIVSYSRPDDVASCARALARLQPTPTFEVFIAENGGAPSFDALVRELTAEGGPCVAADAAGPDLAPSIWVRRKTLRLLRDDGSEGPYLHMAEMPENLGYAGGVNAWLRPLLQVDGWRGAWILNPDTEPEQDALAGLVHYADAHRK